MIITVVAVMCHQLAGINAPVCHEEIVVRDEMSMMACQQAQAALADWKSKSKFHGDQWYIAQYRCSPGTSYQPKDAI